MKINAENHVELIKEPHKGRPQEVLVNLLADKFSNQLNYFGVCGSFGDISEIEAIERAIAEDGENFDVVLSLGGEAFVLYTLDENQHIVNSLSHDKCAAGSGEFFLQQIERLALSLQEAVELAKKGKKIDLASRCSVHCKSDITHKLNRGEESLEDILYSVLYSMVNKVMGLIWQSRIEAKRILLIGGLSKNEAFIQILQEHLTNAQIVTRDVSSVYEAYGAALLVRDEPKHSKPLLKISKTFGTLPSLHEFEHLVTIIQPEKSLSILTTKDSYILGVDVGSTTTKAVLMDPSNQKIVASHYGRTNGNPVKATQECIRNILQQVGDTNIHLVGVTGSGRAIVGAYLGTSAVYNEISAHSVGAAYFDPEVETIFEIGGQDSKYMFLENGVPVDYAMNASCSAGTGSFLEESSKCDLGVSVFEIAQVALKADSPVSFKADCAAFINSDIRTAMQEGYGRENIIAGLVYSIANNYLTKVKGSRPIGKNKIFFQGGVAKNSAVGYAFAQITGRHIIIPPNPELIGAFGISLIALEKYRHSEIERMPQRTSLSSLIQESMRHVGKFTCHACTNLCSIEQYEVGGRKFPFGGRCSKYEHVWKRSVKIEEKEDLVAFRTNMIFREPNITLKMGHRGKIGIPRALLTHSLYPLFSTFFTELGFDVVLSRIDEDMEQTTNAPLCYPMQILHGAILDLIKKEIPSIFVPHIHTLQKKAGWEDSTFCPITQASPYIVSQAFPDANILKPYLDFNEGYLNNTELVDFTSKRFQISNEECQRAYEIACNVQMRIENEFHLKGIEILSKLHETGEIGILLVGRSYNAYPTETSQAIPKKLVSMGITVIPFDFLPNSKEKDEKNFPWYFANLVKEAVSLTKSHSNLFILYINSFSCTIDSFIQNYVRTELKSKPYLFLELDAHQADAGTQTRLEAFIEIIKNYQKTHQTIPKDDFKVPKIEIRKKHPYIISSSGEEVFLDDPRVKIYIPSFSKYHTDLINKMFSFWGFRTGFTTDILPEYPLEGLKHSSGKECNPLSVVIGHIKFISKNRKPGEIIGYWMLTGGSPCVVCNYVNYLESFLKTNQIHDFFIFNIDKYNNFMGIPLLKILQIGPKFVALGDIIHEIDSALRVVGNENSLTLFQSYWEEFIGKSVSFRKTQKHLKILIDQIHSIPRSRDPRTHPKVLISGDFFVRFSPFFLQELSKLYNQHGVIIKSTDLYELLLYGLYFGKMVSGTTNLKNKILASKLALRIMERIERSTRRKFEKTGLLYSHPTDIELIFEKAKTLINPMIFGEAIPAVGKGLETVDGNTFDSLILIGPQFCLPYRISQAILKPVYLENRTPFLVYDAEVTGATMSPNMKRLVLANIQQIKRRNEEQN